MSRLMGQLFNESPLLVWPIISLAIFVLTFLAVFVVTLRRRPAEIDLLAALPLESEGGGAVSVEEPTGKREGGLGDYHGIVHEYDGIIELDNQLPRWWLFTLFGAIVFAAGYWLYFHSYHRADLPMAAYEKEKAAELAAEAEQLKLAGEVTPEMLAKLSHDPATVEQGKAVFAEICVTCHAEGGRGNIGPNLTDDYWLHGSEPLAVYGTIRNGFLPKQMPAWGKTLGEERVRAVSAFVLTIQGSNVTGGKAPQGDKI